MGRLEQAWLYQNRLNIMPQRFKVMEGSGRQGPKSGVDRGWGAGGLIAGCSLPDWSSAVSTR